MPELQQQYSMTEAPGQQKVDSRCLPYNSNLTDACLKKHMLETVKGLTGRSLLQGLSQ